MKKALLLILFAIMQTNLFARSCTPLTYLAGSSGVGGNERCQTFFAPNGVTEFCSGFLAASNYASSCAWCGAGSTASYCQSCGGSSIACHTGCYQCTDACLRDSVLGCPNNQVWNSAKCACEEPPPPPCQVFYHCETYFNTGTGMGVALGPGIGVDTNYSGSGYYAMRLYEVDTCDVNCGPTGCSRLLMDVPGTCEQQGYCPAGDLSCNQPIPGGSSSSAGSSSSSYEPPECVCMGCFGGSCMVTCSDGSNRTCAGDFDNCTELKNSPEWTQCTAPSSSPSGGSSGSGGGGSSSSPPSNQQDQLGALNAIIDTLHHSNQLQEKGHGIMEAGQEQNKSFFDDVRGFFGGLLSQVAGIFGNTQTIANNTSKTNSLLTDIKNKPRDTTIVNVSGDTNIVNVGGDTIIVNVGGDSVGRPWDTAGAVAGARSSWDSLTRALDSLPNPDTIHTGPVDSLVTGVVGSLDSGVGRIYRDTIDGLITQGIANSTLSGQGSNTCPAFIMQSYPLTIGSITFDLTQHVKLGQYLCNPVIGGKSAWDIGRTILRIVVAIGCMFFLFKCATGTLGGDD